MIVDNKYLTEAERLALMLRDELEETNDWSEYHVQATTSPTAPAPLPEGQAVSQESCAVRPAVGEVSGGIPDRALVDHRYQLTEHFPQDSGEVVTELPVYDFSRRQAG